MKETAITIRGAYFYEVYSIFFCTFLFSVTIFSIDVRIVVFFYLNDKTTNEKRKPKVYADFFFFNSSSSLSPQCTRSHIMWIKKNNNRRLFATQKHMKCHCQRDRWNIHAHKISYKIQEKRELWNEIFQWFKMWLCMIWCKCDANVIVFVCSLPRLSMIHIHLHIPFGMVYACRFKVLSHLYTWYA